MTIDVPFININDTMPLMVDAPNSTEEGLLQYSGF